MSGSRGNSFANWKLRSGREIGLRQKKVAPACLNKPFYSEEGKVGVEVQAVTYC